MRYAWITRHKCQWPINLQCDVLGVSASGYFDHVACGGRKDSSRPGGRLSDEAALAHIKAAHAGSKGEYGWPRIWKELISRGVRVGKDRIQKLMKLHGIKARGKRRYVVTTDSKHNLPIAANLPPPEPAPAYWIEFRVGYATVGTRLTRTLPSACHRRGAAGQPSRQSRRLAPGSSGNR